MRIKGIPEHTWKNPGEKGKLLGDKELSSSAWLSVIFNLYVYWF